MRSATRRPKSRPSRSRRKKRKKGNSAAAAGPIGIGANGPAPDRPKFSDQLEGWLGGGEEKTLGSLLELCEQRSFAVLFVVLLGPSALPLPTGGVTNALELIAILLALQLIVGARKIWLPERWRGIHLGGEKQQRFFAGLLKLIRWLERYSRPRLRFLFDHRLSNIVFGLLVMCGTLGSLLAPPFSGLDTLPSLGVVLISLGVLLEDALVAAAGVVVGAVGVILVALAGRAAIHGVTELL